MKIKNLLLAVVLATTCLVPKAQIVVNGNGKKPPTYQMVMHVKQIGEFIERFNYEKTPDNKKIDSTFTKWIDRAGYIGLLFDNQNTGIDSLTKAMFISSVVSRNMILNQNLQLVTAKLTCDVDYRNRKDTLFLTMKTRQDDQGSSEWKIVSVDAPFLNVSKIKDNSLFIPPNKNETYFMNLRDIFAKPQTLYSYTDTTLRIDEFTLLMDALYRNDLKFNYVKQITYYFYQVDGWIFRVNYFDRNTDNSGWLIDHLIKND